MTLIADDSPLSSRQTCPYPFAAHPSPFLTKQCVACHLVPSCSLLAKLVASCCGLLLSILCNLVNTRARGSHKLILVNVLERAKSGHLLLVVIQIIHVRKPFHPARSKIAVQVSTPNSLDLCDVLSFKFQDTARPSVTHQH